MRSPIPVRLNARVTGLSRTAEGFEIRTGGGVFRARQVVVATGPFQVPFVPPAAQRLDGSVTQLHSAGYRNPEALPSGPVLVVGGGNSGFQIAAELARTRNVTLAVADKMPSLPQHALGKDIFWWASATGFMRVSVDSALGRRFSKGDVLIGSSPRRLRRSGARVTTRLMTASRRDARFSDGTTLGDIDAVVWATEYRSDFSWIDVPEIKNADGRLEHRRGVTASPGLFFVGLTWQHSRGSALIGFVKDDAEYIAGRIAGRLGARGRSNIRLAS